MVQGYQTLRQYPRQRVTIRHNKDCTNSLLLITNALRKLLCDSCQTGGGEGGEKVGAVSG